MSKLTDTLVKAGYVAANQGHGAISRMLWKGASMGDQARSQVQIGRASCRERVESSGVGGSLKKKKKKKKEEEEERRKGTIRQRRGMEG